MQPLIANFLWYLSTLPDAMRYHWAVQHIENTQTRLLLATIRANEKTVFGREHNFENIHSISDFQHQIPLTDYDNYSSYIDRISAGESTILTHETVNLLEPTSGSTAATKFIPYTATLKQQFNRGIAPWIANLFTQKLSLMAGQAYWSVSPIDAENRFTSGGIPIGFEDDTDYLGNAGALLQSIMAVPSLVKLIQNMDTFRYVTLLFLLRSANLRLISVWNPTFLTILLDCIPQWGEQLASDIENRTLNPPANLSLQLKNAILKQSPANPQRAVIIRQALTFPAPARHRTLWPKLGLVSSWADGAATHHAKRLHDLLPQAHFQGKGLIATEAFISFPLFEKEGTALAITSHFLEFISEADDIHLAHELVKGEKYRVVVTTGGGLYRYQLHDLIESLGGLQIRFIGRSANISDYFGEKISEGHVRTIFKKIFSETPSFATLSPEEYEDGTIAYTLFSTVAVSAEILEQHLKENFHYAYCRRLNQLSHARVFQVTENAHEQYLQACIARGQRSGDVKASLLYRHGGLYRFLI